MSNNTQSQKNMLNLCIFASGGGGNLQYLISSQGNSYNISIVVVDRCCGAQEVAQSARIPVINLMNYRAKGLFDMISTDKKVMGCDMIVLAGFMPIVPENFIDLYGKPILNTHPSLLPDFGGKGMYGVRVHEAVVKSGRKITGCSCHLVDGGIDTGEVICQTEIEIDSTWDAWTLGGHVFRLEGPNLVKGIELVGDTLR